MAQKDGRSPLQKAQARLSSVVSTLSPFSIASWPYSFPSFDNLKPVAGQPQGSLWGFFDKNGGKDELGTLNLLTPSIVQAAAREIRTGQRIQLDRQLENGQSSGMGRRPFEQKVIDHSKSSKIVGYDDEVTMNTQGSSQWDGLKHFAHQTSRTYYNGVSHEDAGSTATNGIHNWCNAGGIVGRGVLIDWLSWYEHKHGDPPSPATRHEITAAELAEVLKYQGTTTRPGDILLVRSGYGRWFDKATPEEKTSTNKAIGLQGSEAVVRWLYENHFSAVAGDTIAFEAWTPGPSLKSGWCLHEWLLVSWGTPIGELWDLEKLSRMCEHEGRWTFFLASAPLRVRGGVGSPPGVIAVF